MTDERPGPGEKLEAARRRRKKWIMGASFVAGLVVGGIIGFREAGNLFDDPISLSPALAIGIAVSYVLVVLGGGFALARQTDEFERLERYKSAAAGASVYMVGYPVWLVLWMGGLVREPMHGILFLAFCVGVVSAFVFYRFR